MTEWLIIIAIAQVKGGVGKTTTAIHIAAYMQTLAPTVLANGDIVRAGTKWSQRGTGLPFKVVPVGQLAKHIRDYEHVVIDTEANPPTKTSRTWRRAATCSSCQPSQRRRPRTASATRSPSSEK